MAIKKILAGQGLTGGGSTQQVSLAIDTTVVPLLQGDNSFAGTQTVTGDLDVDGTLSAEYLAVATTEQVPNLNATLLEGVPSAGFAKTSAHNTFVRGQTINGTVVVSANEIEQNPYPEFSSSAAGVIGFGANGYSQDLSKTIPQAGAGVFGWGGDQIDQNLGTGGDGVTGMGGDQIGYGGGGTGVSGTGGDGSDGKWGGGGGDFIGGIANNGDSGYGVSSNGGHAYPPTRALTPDEFSTAGNGIDAYGGMSWSPNAGPGIGGLFFGGSAQYVNGSDGIWGVPGYGNTSKQDGRAGVFEGNVLVMGSLHVSGHKSFRIDHPLRPADSLLAHACVESSELLTIYSGNVTLNRKGKGTVKLPKWFEALNTDFRYQLTPIGAFAPVFIEREIENRRFVIAGGLANMKVSWQITSVRHDAHAQANPFQVEIEKSKRERGFYVHPEAFGQELTKGLHWATHPNVMKRLVALREKFIAGPEKSRPAKLKGRQMRARLNKSRRQLNRLQDRERP